ncbi:unnamed protein product, partial [Symbiodinium sp. KB8]
MGSRSTLVSILLCICFLFKRGWAQAGPEDPFAGHLAADGWPLRVCWAAEEPGHTMRVLPVQYDEEDFNVTAAALRHMLELGLDDFPAVNALEQLYHTVGSEKLRRMHIATEIQADDSLQGNQTYHNEMHLGINVREAALWFCSAHMPSGWTGCVENVGMYFQQFYDATQANAEKLPPDAWLPKTHLSRTAQPEALLLRERFGDSRYPKAGYFEDLYNLLHFPELEREHNENKVLAAPALHALTAACSLDPTTRASHDAKVPSSRRTGRATGHAAPEDETPEVPGQAPHAPPDAVRVLHVVVHQNVTNATHNAVLAQSLASMTNSSRDGLHVSVLIVTGPGGSLPPTVVDAVPEGVQFRHLPLLDALSPGSFAWAARKALSHAGVHEASQTPLYDLFSFWDVRHVVTGQHLRSFWEWTTQGGLPEDWVLGFASWHKVCHSRSAFAVSSMPGMRQGNSVGFSHTTRLGYPSIHKGRFCARHLDWGMLSHNDAYRVYRHESRRFLVTMHADGGGWMLTAGQLAAGLRRGCIATEPRSHWAYSEAQTAYTDVYYACGLMRVLPLECMREFMPQRRAANAQLGIHLTEDKGFMTDRVLQAWATDCTDASDASVPEVTPTPWEPYEQDWWLAYDDVVDEVLAEDEAEAEMGLNNAVAFPTSTGGAKRVQRFSEVDSDGKPVQPLIEGIEDEVGFAPPDTTAASTA